MSPRQGIVVLLLFIFGAVRKCEGVEKTIDDTKIGKIKLNHTGYQITVHTYFLYFVLSDIISPWKNGLIMSQNIPQNAKFKFYLSFHFHFNGMRKLRTLVIMITFFLDFPFLFYD